MVRATHNKNEGCGVLPTGGPLEVGLRGTTKVVDLPISALDRQRRHIARKQEEPSKIFVPLDPSDVPRDPNRGKNLHTDPFAEDRPHIEFKRAKAKVQTPRGLQRPVRRVVKPVPPPAQTENKKEFIASNGMKHTSPKRVSKEKHEMTINREQPHKSYVGSQRFANNPHKQDAVRGTQGALMSTSEYSMSNVFNRTAEQSQETPVAIAAPPRVAVKPNPKRFALTMEGVFSPMRGGQPPKPSAIAPWLKDQRAAVSCKKQSAISGDHTAPFAIEAKK